MSGLSLPRGVKLASELVEIGHSEALQLARPDGLYDRMLTQPRLAKECGALGRCAVEQEYILRERAARMLLPSDVRAETSRQSGCSS